MQRLAGGLRRRRLRGRGRPSDLIVRNGSSPRARALPTQAGQRLQRIAPAGDRADQLRRADQPAAAPRSGRSARTPVAPRRLDLRSAETAQAAAASASRPHSASVAAAGSTRDSIHTARPRNTKPNTRCTATIHGPLVGRPLPGGDAEREQRHAHAHRQQEQRRAAEHRILALADVEHARPRAAAPRTGRRSAPTARPSPRRRPSEPPRWRSLSVPEPAAQRGRQLQFVQAERSTAPAPRTAAANAPITHGFWNATCRLAPTSPATTPATVNTSALASTYTNDSANARRAHRGAGRGRRSVRTGSGSSATRRA